jgi:hypothetical protein
MRRSLKILLALLAFAAFFANCSRGQTASDSAAAAADFIFSGTVLRAHAATIDLEDATGCAIVRVDRILVGGDAFRPLTGRAITVRLRQPEQARETDRRVYFTKGWHWGEDIGVIELNSVTAPSGPELRRMQSDIERQRQQQSDRELTERLRTAELVVIGRVVSVRRAELPALPTEHDPNWQEAVIEVASVLRGTQPGARVTILFPGTDDPMWRAAPKYRRGTEGVWLLRPLTFEGKPLPRLTAPHPEDFRPRSDEARIRRLLPK